jgi:hypothetical protein
MTSLHQRIKSLTDQQLAALAHSLRSPPRPDDVVRVIETELGQRQARKRDAERLPLLLQQMSERMTGAEDIAQISEAMKCALLLHLPGSLAARQLAAKARGQPMPQGGNVERRRYVPPEAQPSPDVAVPAQTAPELPAAKDLSVTNVTKSVTNLTVPAASNVVPFRCYGKFFSGRSHETVWHQGE